jgi:hypothetical protein
MSMTANRSPDSACASPATVNGSTPQSRLQRQRCSRRHGELGRRRRRQEHVASPQELDPDRRRCR